MKNIIWLSPSLAAGAIAARLVVFFERRPQINPRRGVELTAALCRSAHRGAGDADAAAGLGADPHPGCHTGRLSLRVQAGRRAAVHRRYVCVAVHGPVSDPGGGAAWRAVLGHVRPRPASISPSRHMRRTSSSDSLETSAKSLVSSSCSRPGCIPVPPWRRSDLLTTQGASIPDWRTLPS